MARTDGNSFVDVAAFVDDDACAQTSPFLSIRRRRRRGMRLPRLLTHEYTLIFSRARKDASRIAAFLDQCERVYILRDVDRQTYRAACKAKLANSRSNMRQTCEKNLDIFERHQLICFLSEYLKDF